MPRQLVVPSRDELMSRIDYNPDTGAFVWKTLTEDHFPGRKYPKRDAARHNKSWAGKPCGNLTGKRLVISFLCNNWHASILAMIISGKYVPGMMVDHINGNSMDNRLCNLRMVTLQQNQFNRRDIGSVEWEESRRKWRARMVFSGSRISLGRYRTKGMAMLAIAKRSMALHGMHSPFLRKVAVERNA